MAEPPGEDNGLDFSDIDSDNESVSEKDVSKKRSVIAHKEMRYSAQDEDGENEFEPISPPLDSLNDQTDDGLEGNSENFDLVSPASPPDADAESNSEQKFYTMSPNSDSNSVNVAEHSNQDALSPGQDMPSSPDENAPISPTEPDQFEPISPPTSPKSAGQAQFENISDDDEDGPQRKSKTREFASDGHFSPVVESDNELNFDENSNDSGYHVVQKSSKNLSHKDAGLADQKSNKSKENLQKKGHAHDEDVEAPIPSPFSDIGDIEDMSDHDGAIVSDLMKDDIGKHFNVPASDMPLDKGDVSVLHKAGPSQGSDEEASASQAHSDISKKPMFDEEDIGKEVPDDVGGLIADIFGESDDEEEEFEGFAEEELLPEKTQEPVSEEESEDEVVKDKENKKSRREPQEEEGDDAEDHIPSRDFVSDFDLMLQKRKEMNRMKRRARKDIDILNDNDDIIAAMLKQMKEAAEEDRILNQCGKAATKKMSLLDTIVCHLRKADLINTFIDSGVLPAMKDWLSPLPDNSLPHINIRKAFLRLLSEFPPLDKGALKISGIGRAVMLLFKHPKEVPENKRLAEKIISNWARPIFNLNTNFKEMSKEEREDRDKASTAAKRPRLSSSDEKKYAEDDANRPRKPGDPGWVGRARVPMPSNRDYLVRPKSRVEGFDVGKGLKSKTLSRFEKQQRKMKDKRTVLSGTTRQAVGISINGTKMAL